jgi:lysophospholipase L1-like esterase
VMHKLGLPVLVTVMIGVNDLFKARLRQRLPESVRSLVRQLPTGTIIGSIPSKMWAVVAANDLLLEEATRAGLVFGDMSPLVHGFAKGKLAADHAHPNDRGHGDIACIFADAIEVRKMEQGHR